MKALGLSRGVNQMWTEKNDHAPKSECVGFLQYMPKKGTFEEEENIKFAHSLVFSWALLVFTSC
jgi:hypothetical protein